jgi:hypothetical protein
MHSFEQFESAGPGGSAVAASEMAVTRAESGNGRVAVLLAVAAVVAALIGWQAAVISNSAGSDWQSALRTEVKRSAAAQEDVRYLYQNELPVAIRVLQARALESAYRAAAKTATGPAQLALKVEADTQAQVASALEKNYELSSSPAYALPSGGLDLAKRLADLRATSPGILALDPGALETQGDALASRANLLTLTLLPTSIGALFGVLAQPLRRYRDRFLALGWTGVVVGGGLALAIFGEVLS